MKWFVGLLLFGLTLVKSPLLLAQTDTVACEIQFRHSTLINDTLAFQDMKAAFESQLLETDLISKLVQALPDLMLSTNIFLENISIHQIKYSNTYRITYQNTSQQEGLVILSTYLEKLQDYSYQKDLDVFNNRLSFIDHQLELLRNDMIKNEETLRAFKNENGIQANEYEIKFALEKYSKLDAEHRAYKHQMDDSKKLENLVQNDELTLGKVLAMDLGFLFNELRQLIEIKDSLGTKHVSYQDHKTVLIEALKLHSENNEMRIKSIQEELNKQQYLLRSMDSAHTEMQNIVRTLNVKEKVYTKLLEDKTFIMISKAGMVPKFRILQKPYVFK